MSSGDAKGEADAGSTGLDEQQAAIRHANIEQFDRQIGRRIRLLQIILGVLLLLCVNLIIAFMKGSHATLFLGACIFAFALWLLVSVNKQNSRLRKLRNETVEAGSAVRRLREVERRQREGIRPRHRSDIVVDPSEWVASNHVRTDWVEGQIQELRPDDLVLKWDAHVQRGLCLERNGIIIASRTLMYISW